MYPTYTHDSGWMASPLLKSLKNKLSRLLCLFRWEVHFINLHCCAKFKTQDEPHRGQSLNHDDIHKNESWSLALALIKANNFPRVRVNSWLEFKSQSPFSKDKEARSKFSVLTNLLCTVPFWGVSQEVGSEAVGYGLFCPVWILCSHILLTEIFSSWREVLWDSGNK